MIQYVSVDARGRAVQPGVLQLIFHGVPNRSTTMRIATPRTPAASAIDGAAVGKHVEDAFALRSISRLSRTSKPAGFLLPRRDVCT